MKSWRWTGGQRRKWDVEKWLQQEFPLGDERSIVKTPEY